MNVILCFPTSCEYFCVHVCVWVSLSAGLEGLWSVLTLPVVSPITLNNKNSLFLDLSTLDDLYLLLIMTNEEISIPTLLFFPAPLPSFQWCKTAKFTTFCFFPVARVPTAV